MSKPHGPSQKAAANGPRVTPPAIARPASPRPVFATRNADRAAKAGRTYVGRHEPRNYRAQILTARLQKELGKARTNTKRAIKSGDADRANRHLQRVGDLTRRLETSVKHMTPGRWLN